MRYAGIIKNDVVNGQDVCVSFWCQGCPYRCHGCHNPQTWDFNGGKEADEDALIEELMKDISLNGVQRNLSILGGEPLCTQNISFVKRLLKTAKEQYPNIKTFVWTGNSLEEAYIADSEVFNWIDVIIDGRFDAEKRDVTLAFRGSTNQRIFVLNKEIDADRFTDNQ